MATSGDTVLHKLQHSVLSRLASFLDPHADWKLLAACITRNGTSEPLYSINQIDNFETAWQRPGKTPTLALLKDWATKNATLCDLKNALVVAKLTRAAEYISSDVLLEEEASQKCNNKSSNYETERSFCLNEFQKAEPEDDLAAAPNITHDTGTFEKVLVINAGNTPHWPYLDLAKQTDNFNEERVDSGGSLLGEGGFGLVFLAKSPENGTLRKFAVKRLKSDKTSILRQFKAEIEALVRCRHENLVPLVALSYDGPHFCLVYEYMGCGSLDLRLACLNETKPLSWQQRVQIALETGSGLNYLHSLSPELVHRDVKSANVLLDDDLRAHLGDFGLARFNPSSSVTSFATSTVIGTSAYMPPEAYHGTVTTKTDVYAFGVLLLELITGLPAFDPARDDSDLISHVEEGFDGEEKLEILDQNAAGCNVDSVRKMFQLAHTCYRQARKDRPTMQQIIEDLKKF